jgi:hypothetical protein
MVERLEDLASCWNCHCFDCKASLVSLTFIEHYNIFRSHDISPSYYLLQDENDIEQVPDAELKKFGTLFSTPYLQRADIIPPEQLHEHGPENQIFDRRGLCIPRFRLKEVNHAQECGVLFKGQGIHSKFAAPDDAEMTEEYTGAPLSARDVRFFPQAFLPSCGQVQADRPFTEQQAKAIFMNSEEKELLSDAMEEVDLANTPPSNSNPHQPTPSNGSDSSESRRREQQRAEEERAARRQLVGTDLLADFITVPKWQGYSYIAHSASTSASSFDSMRGYITSQLGGFRPPHGALDKKGQDSYSLATEQNNGGLPFEKMGERLNNCKGSALRLEPTMVLNLRAMANKTGEDLYQAMGRFMGSYDTQSSPRVTENAVIILYPGVPNLLLTKILVTNCILLSQIFEASFSWTSFPLHCYVQVIRDLCLRNKTILSPRHRLHEFLTELASAAERALCYGQTGNAKVICNDVMSHILLKPSILNGGMPTIAAPFVPKNGQFFFDANDWPLTFTERPQSAAKKTLAYWYGKGPAEVRDYLTFKMLRARVAYRCTLRARVARHSSVFGLADGVQLVATCAVRISITGC